MKYIQVNNSNTIIDNKIHVKCIKSILISIISIFIVLIIPDIAKSNINNPLLINDLYFGIYDNFYINDYHFENSKQDNNDNETDNQNEGEDEDDTDSQVSDKDKLKAVLMDFDRSLIEDLANALDIIFDEDDSKEDIIDMILNRIEIVEAEPSDDEQDEQDQQQDDETDEQTDQPDRTDITSPLTGEKWNLDFDTLSLFTFEVGDKSYTKLIAYGNCIVTFGPTVLKSDLIILNRPPQEENTEEEATNIEVMVYGNIEVESGGSIFLAERGFFYPDDLNTILYDVIAYFPQSANPNFILKADTVKLVTGTDEIIGIEVETSSSHYEFPHYKFTGDKIWYYPDSDNIFISNMTFQVGQSILLYFPFLFQTQFTSGIRTDMRYYRGIGFYIQTTTPFNILDFSNTLYFDYYQRMGIYFALEESIKLPFFSINVSGAIDRAVRDVRGVRFPEIYSNYVDIDNDGIYEETFRSFRYDFSLQSDTFTLFQGDEVNLENLLSENEGTDILDKLNEEDLSTLQGLISQVVSSLNVTMDYSFSRKSDPLFPSQFETISKDRPLFDILTTINEASSDAPAGTAPDVPGGSSNAMNLTTGLNITTDNFTFGFNGNWNWSFTSRVGELNPYDVLNYYDYQITSAKFPSITLSMKNLFKIDNLVDNLILASYKLFDVDKEYEDFSDIVEGMKLKLSFNINYLNFNSNPNTTYFTDSTEIKETEDDRAENYGEIKKDQTTQKTSFKHTTNFEIGYNDMVTFTTSMSYDINHNYQSTKVDRSNKEMTPEEIQQDDLNKTYFDWGWNLNPRININLFKEYEFLSFNFNLGVSFKKSGKFDDLIYHLGLSDTETGSSESLNPTEVNKLNFPTLSFTFFKTTISFSGIIIPLGLSEDELEDLGDITKIDAYEFYDLDDIFILVDKDYLLEEKKSPAYIFTVNFNDLIKDLTLSLSYSEYNRLRFLDYYYEQMGGREYVNELYGYPSIFGGSGRDASITLGYLFKFGKSSLPDSTFTNQLKAQTVYKHYFGNAEYEKDTLDTTLNYDIDITQIYLNSIILKSFGVDFRFNHNFGYEQFKDDYITIDVNLNFDLGSLWTLNINYSVKNNNIWRYFEREDNPNPRNPFYDIFLAISIWDTKSLTQTFWKIQSLSFNVEHDLAEWEMLFGVNVNFEVDPVFGYILFKPEFTLSIRLLDLESFSGGSDSKGEIDLDFFDRF